MMTIVSIWSDQYAPLAELTVHQNRQLYCEARGYRCVNKQYPSLNATSAGYDRMEWLLELMSVAGKEDWFWCLGVDAMVMNFTVPVERFTQGEHHMVITRDVNVECLNGDSYMVKASEEGKAIIEKLVTERHLFATGAAECNALAKMAHENPWMNYINIVPQRLINSYDYTLYGPNLGAPPGAQPRAEIEHRAAEGQFHDGDFVIHWPAIPFETRMRLAAEYISKVKLK